MEKLFWNDFAGKSNVSYTKKNACGIHFVINSGWSAEKTDRNGPRFLFLRLLRSSTAVLVRQSMALKAPISVLWGHKASPLACPYELRRVLSGG